MCLRVAAATTSVYVVADQMVWHRSADDPQSVGIFVRAMGAPGDRNLVDLGMNAGVSLKAPFRGRDNDVVGLAVGYAKIGSHAQDLASDTASPTTPDYPSRSAETVLEATYQCQVAPWWQLQADVQYTFRPAGGIPNPENPSQRIGNEAVVGRCGPQCLSERGRCLLNAAALPGFTPLEHRMFRRIERRPQSQPSEHDKDDCGEYMNRLGGQAVGEPVPQIDDRHVGQHHPERGSRDDAKELMEARSQRNGDNLSLVTHLGEEERGPPSYRRHPSTEWSISSLRHRACRE